MQDLDWNDLRVFLAVAETGQIGRAAARLRLDATTLGRRLRRLERVLDATLFERTRDGQVLTEAGEALLPRAEGMADIARTIADHRAPHAGLGGHLRISVSEGFGTQFLMRYLPAFSQAHPALTIELIASSGFLNPSKREADIAVMLSRPKAGPVLCQKLTDYRLMLFASSAYLARAGTPASPAALAHGHTLISYAPDLVYAPELDYLSEFHPGLSARLRSSSINAQARLVAEGAGIGVLPAFMAGPDTGLVPVCPDKSITRSFWIITHRDTQQLARVKAGRRWLQASVADGADRLAGRF